MKTQENKISSYTLTVIAPYDLLPFLRSTDLPPSPFLPSVWKVSVGADDKGNAYTFTGRKGDDLVRLINFRNRWYSANLARFVSRDSAGYVDGMNLYANYFGVNSTDAFGLWSANDPENVTASAGDKLETLAKIVLGPSANEKEIECIWPVSMKKMPRPNDHPKKWCISKGDKFDVTNLLGFNHKSYTIHTYQSYTGDFLTYKTTFSSSSFFGQGPYLNISNQSGFIDAISTAAGRGKTPISSLIVTGHNGGPQWPLTYTLTVLNRATYARAKVKEGPPRCWFKKNATARFVGCKSTLTAETAEDYFRSSAKLYYFDVEIGVGKVYPHIDVPYKKGTEYSNADTLYTSPYWKYRNGTL